MSTMIVSGVDENSMQPVLGRSRLGPLEEVVEHDLLEELVSVVELDVRVGLRVVLESHEMQVQHGRERLEDYAFLRLL